MDFIDYREKLGIGFDDNEKISIFYKKLFNVLDILVKDGTVTVSLDEYFNFCSDTGTSLNTSLTKNYLGRERFEDCIHIIREHQYHFSDFLSYYVWFLNSICNIDNMWSKKNFKNLLVDCLNESHIPYDLLNKDGMYFVFPKGATDLDKALVSETLEWLKNYEGAEKAFVKALKAYSEATENNASDVADLFRKALETFFQEFFGGGRSLEKYVSDHTYEQYLDKRGVPVELRGEFKNTIEMYSKFINNNAKHHDKTTKNVLEYIMYQTGNIIRFLTTLKEGEENA